MASILVFGEIDDAGLTAPTLELLGAASRLSSDLGGGVALALIGSGLADAASAAGPAGADTVYTADSDSLASYQTDSYLPVAQGIVEQDSPSVVLMAQSSMGRDLAPRLATRLGTAAIMDSLGLEVDGDRVKATRSCYGGNARQVVTVQTDPQVITVRPKSQDPLEADASRSARSSLSMLPSQPCAPAPPAKNRQNPKASASRTPKSSSQAVADLVDRKHSPTSSASPVCSPPRLAHRAPPATWAGTRLPNRSD